MDQEQEPINKRKEWQSKNKDKIALAGRRYYEKMKSNPEFMQKKRDVAKTQREKQKQLKLEKQIETEKQEIKTPIEIKIGSTKKPTGRPRKYV